MNSLLVTFANLICVLMAMYRLITGNLSETEVILNYISAYGSLILAGLGVIRHDIGKLEK